VTPATSPNLYSLSIPLSVAQNGRYALGSFSPRGTAMIGSVLRTAQRLRAPLIVQISSNELRWYRLSAADFAAEFYRCLAECAIDVPVVLHLDHTKDLPLIAEAIEAGFTSVMLDASDSPLAENIERTRAAVALAHPRGVSVEGELGRIGTTDFIETDDDEELYTDPDEAQYFVARSGVDALAVSVGTAHGVYTVRAPRIDYERLKAIRARTAVPLVLHGGSGIPAEMLARAIALPGGGVSKINIATDLEQAALGALGRSGRLSDAEMRALPRADLLRAQSAVERVVAEKIERCLQCGGRADDAAWAGAGRRTEEDAHGR